MRKSKRRFTVSVETLEGRLLLSASPQYTIQDLGTSNASILPSGFPMSVSLSPGGSATGIAINSSGQITGTSTPPPGVYAQSQAFFYSNGVMTDITPGAWDAEGISINNSGQVAGVETPANGYSQAFMTGPNGNGLTVISGNGSVSGLAYSINSNGDVVGRSSIPNLGTRGFLYKNGTFYDLNDLLIQPITGDHIAQAFSINDTGQILALGNGTERYLLTPVTPPSPVTPAITWSNPADIVYGTPITATQLNATADVPGTFTYNVAQGTVLHAGAAQSLVATFTPTDTEHYTTATAAVSLNVTPAPLTVTANNATKVQGQANPTFTGTITGLVNGDTDVATYSTTATTSSPAGTYDIVPFLVDSNYAITFVSGTLTVTPKPAGYRPPPSPW